MPVGIHFLLTLMAGSAFFLGRSFLPRSMHYQTCYTSYKTAQNEIPINELLRGNFGRSKNGKLRRGPSIEQSQRLKEHNRIENARIPNSAYSHLKLAHHLWSEVVKPGDICIDATCGNGHDSALMAQLLGLVDVRGPGKLYCMDVQEIALQNTKMKILEKIQPADIRNDDGCCSHNDSLFNEKVSLVLRNHRTFPEEIEENSVKLIAYNLGYLPGGDKGITTQTDSTLESIKNAMPLLKSCGLLSVLCYRRMLGLNT